MSNEVITYEFPVGAIRMPVRIALRAGVPWFVLVDVCRVLEIGNPSMAAARLDDDEKMTLSTAEGHSGQRGGAQSMTVVNQSGLYSLILTSRKPEAKAFKKWVTSVVLPSIHENGGYIKGQEKLVAGQMSDAEFLAQAYAVSQRVLAAAQAERDRLAAQNAVLVEELEQVTIDEWRALNHVYLNPRDKGRISGAASRSARAMGVSLEKQPRVVPTPFGDKETAVNVYPRSLLDETARALGFEFMRSVPVAA